MRILQVNKLYHPWIGGIETVAKDIAEHLNGKEEVTVTNLVCQPRGKREVTTVNGVTTYRAASWGIVSGMPLSLDFFRLFNRLAKDADLIILHHPFPIAFVAYRYFGHNTRLAVWYHSDIVRQRITKLPFMPFIDFGLQRASHVFVSNKAIVMHSKLLRKVRDKCDVIYFGIDKKRYELSSDAKGEAEALRTRYGAPLILSVGRLVYYKGYSYLIDAMKRIPNAYLLIVGKGPLRGVLEKQIEANGLRGRVSIIDAVDDLVPYYYACDVFAFPSCSDSEVFGLVQIEAMACGKPVVNTSLPTGVPEVSVDGRTGITVPPRNVEALAAAISDILTDRGKYLGFSKSATIDVAERFTVERFLYEMEMKIL